MCSPFIAFAFLFSLTTSNLYAQNNTPPTLDESMVGKRIGEIMKAVVTRGEITLNEQVVITIRSLPSEEELDEVKRYGDAAVPVLAEYLTSEDGRFYHIALRFLGELGGGRIVGPLQRIILFDPSAGRREYALRWIGQAPWELAGPIIHQAAEADPDAGVRETAKDMLRNAPQ
jgi:HEAT repeat protein